MDCSSFLGPESVALQWFTIKNPKTGLFWSRNPTLKTVFGTGFLSLVLFHHLQAWTSVGQLYRSLAAWKVFGGRFGCLGAKGKNLLSSRHGHATVGCKVPALGVTKAHMCGKANEKRKNTFLGAARALLRALHLPPVLHELGPSAPP